MYPLLVFYSLHVQFSFYIAVDKFQLIVWLLICYISNLDESKIKPMHRHMIYFLNVLVYLLILVPHKSLSKQLADLQMYYLSRALYKILRYYSELTFAALVIITFTTLISAPTYVGRHLNIRIQTGAIILDILEIHLSPAFIVKGCYPFKLCFLLLSLMRVLLLHDCLSWIFAI
jgi:hypothetical protein